MTVCPSFTKCNYNFTTAIHEFMTEMRTNVQNDVSSWRDRSYRMRQDLVTKLTSSVMSPSPSSSIEQQSRRALLTPNNVVNKGWDLIVNAGTAMKNVIDASSVKVHQFLSDILGKNWATVVPANWALDCEFICLFSCICSFLSTWTQRKLTTRKPSSSC